ncbi:hypothetical protein [Ktedonospora formicarum]|uniref:hypothetical protein n=1 Tax=Ktedonospora formicarum TaxID=2778364 RepID=UPI001C687BE8|nr:hypothetical protein [Ktedonospora formicarum]
MQRFIAQHRITISGIGAALKFHIDQPLSSLTLSDVWAGKIAHPLRNAAMTCSIPTAIAMNRQPNPQHL